MAQWQPKCLLAVAACLLSVVAAKLPVACPTSDAYPWCDTTKALQERVDLLLKELTDMELPGLLGNDLFAGTASVERLGVPPYLWVREGLHGLLKVDVNPPTTSFPQVILTAASFNQTLYEAIGEATAAETLILWGVTTQDTPKDGLLVHANFNLFRDPRWGRGQETPGEDPVLTAAYARAWVRGVQGYKSPDQPLRVGASCKHYLAYSFAGRPPVTRHSFDAIVSKQDLADSYTRAFEGCVQEGAMGLMCAYNSVNGTPMCANDYFLDTVARKQWGFDGVVVTDCGAVEDVELQHHLAATPEQAVEMTIAAGADVECGHYYESIKDPKIAAKMRTSVERVLRTRFRLGEFDPPPATKPPLPTKMPEAHAKLALEAALQGMVLLKNENSVLPLKAGIRLAVLGPLRNGTWQMQGDYSSYPVPVVTPLEGLKPYVKELIVPDAGPADVCAPPGQEPEKPDADVVLVIAGLNSEDMEEPDPEKRFDRPQCLAGCLETEGCDRPSLAWPKGQELLIKQAAAWGLPLVLAVASGGPLDLSKFAVHEGVNSILWMGYPGQAAGTALASLLFGEESPSGRLPLTFYTGEFAHATPTRSMELRSQAALGVAPTFVHFDAAVDGVITVPPEDRPGRTYRFVDKSYVVYPFGYGLSYLDWRYSWGPDEAVAAAQTAEHSWENCRISVEVSLASGPAAKGASTPVLLFLRPPLSAGPTAPKKELRQFGRVRLEAGEQNTRITFSLPARDFELADVEGQWVLQEGTWTAEVGEPAVLTQAFEVSADGCKAKTTRAEGEARRLAASFDSFEIQV